MHLACTLAKTRPPAFSDLMSVPRQVTADCRSLSCGVGATARGCGRRLIRVVVHVTAGLEALGAARIEVACCWTLIQTREYANETRSLSYSHVHLDSIKPVRVCRRIHGRYGGSCIGCIGSGRL